MAVHVILLKAFNSVRRETVVAQTYTMLSK